MKEKAVTFGAAPGLVGILTEPDPGCERGERPAVILLNAGFVHRVGPNRIYVKLARDLAPLGVRTLRLDLSGIGDSPSREDNLPLETSSVQETQQAMDYLERTQGVHGFLLAGICSGADTALRTACCDRRVVAVAAINGSFLDGLHAQHLSRVLDDCIRRRYYRKYLLDRRRWWKFLTGKTHVRGTAGLVLRQIRTPRRPRAAGPARVDLSTDCRLLLSRGVRLLLVYSEGSSAWDAFHLTLEAGLEPWRPSDKLRVEKLEDVDHVFTPLWSQRLLVDLVHRWVQDAWMVTHE